VDGELQPKVAAAATRFESNFSAIPAPSPGTAPTSPPDRQIYSMTPGRGFTIPEEQGRALTTPPRAKKRRVPTRLNYLP